MWDDLKDPVRWLWSVAISVVAMLALNWALGTERQVLYSVLGGDDYRVVILGENCERFRNYDPGSGFHCESTRRMDVGFLDYRGEDHALVIERSGKWWGYYVESYQFVDLDR